MPGLLSSSVEFREFLIGRNLPPPVPFEIKEGFLQAFYQDIGKVIGVPNSLVGEYIQFDEEGGIELDGESSRDVLLNYNRYINQDEAREYEVITPNIDATKQRRAPYNTQNFGLIYNSSNIGISNPFTAIDANRTLEFESPLGIIGSEQLEFHITEKVNQNLINETIDRVNTNPLSLAQGNSLIIPKYDITVAKNPIGKGVDFIGKIQGIQLPVSIIPKGAIGWQEFNTAKGGKVKQNVRKILSKLGITSELGLSTEKRMDELLGRTSTGQKKEIFSLLSRNQYIPDYSSPRLFGLLGDRAPTSRYYIGNESSTNNAGGIGRIFRSEDFNGNSETDAVKPPNNFSWSPYYDDVNGNVTFNDKTILSKTKELLDNYSETDVYINQTSKFFKDKVTGRKISRGNAISKTTEGGEIFCRVWTKSVDPRESGQLTDGYSYKNAIRNSGLFTKQDGKPGFSTSTDKSSLSVLQNNGIVKTHPILDDSITTFKKYMLSIENLAWTDNIADLPLQEIGPGDLISGHKGRMMWFAPYDVQFDESVTANWQGTDFIGRGEPVYTYNNTKRSGQLRFKILVDHPRIMNEYRGRQNNNIEKFVAGCVDPNEFLELIQKNSSLLDQSTKAELEKKVNSIVRESKSSNNSQRSEFQVYFEDGSSDLPTDSYNPQGLNETFLTIQNEGEGSFIGQVLKFNERSTISIRGFQSKAGEDGKNIDDEGSISSERIDEVKTFLQTLANSKAKFKSIDKKDTSSAASKDGIVDGDLAIKDRRVEVIIEYNPTTDEEIAEPSKQLGAPLNEIIGQDLDVVRDLFINETSYYEMIDDEFPNYFATISEKIKYFHPGFHSNTPEGLNSRLTFLQQCMRQGPSIYDKSDTIKPQNLAFGRPPVCILRLGDFFHSKVLINNLNINYAGGGNSPQWDLNPEGIGVQPMIVDVNMSIEIIGGQSMRGPINRLQNALSFNYYANTEMYDPRSDTIKLDGGKGEIQDGIKLSEQREKAGINTEQYAKQLKSEIPIDEEASKEKEAAYEAAEEAKIKGSIEFDSGPESEVNKIIVRSKKGGELSLPSLIVDATGTNKLRVEFSDMTSQLKIEEFNEETKEYGIANFDKYSSAASTAQAFAKLDNELNSISTKLNSLSGGTNSSDRKIEKYEKEYSSKFDEIQQLRSSSAIKIKAKGFFTNDINVSKTKIFTYVWDTTTSTYKEGNIPKKI
jgi:hypothetical protein